MPTSGPGSRLGRPGAQALSTTGCGCTPYRGTWGGCTPSRRSCGGFTLLELLIVVAVIALVSGLSIMALRDPASAQLEQEATRLAALLDAARLESRTSGQAVTWRPRPTRQAQGMPRGREADFQFEPHLAAISGLPSTGPSTGPEGGTSAQATGAWPTQWLHPGTRAEVIGASSLVLGPEPLIAPQRVRLRLGGQEQVLATDGLGGFRLEATP